MSKTTVFVIFLLGLSLGIIGTTFSNLAKKAIEAEMPTEAEEAELTMSPEAKEIVKNLLTDNLSDYHWLTVSEGLDANTESLVEKWSGTVCTVSFSRVTLEPTPDCHHSTNINKPGVSVHMARYKLIGLIRYPEAKPQ